MPLPRQGVGRFAILNFIEQETVCTGLQMSAHKNSGVSFAHRYLSFTISEGAGARTLDLRIKSPLLYQLSYAL